MSSMSIAVVAEGPTDVVVIESALKSIFAGRTFVLTQLQPSGSIAFGNLGGGWGGVYRWCKQNINDAGKLDALLQERFDAIIVHLDADVADANYRDANIRPLQNDLALPCAIDRPPAAPSCSALRAVLFSWLGSLTDNQNLVSCIPSMTTENWVVAILFPNDALSLNQSPECYPNPESRLAVKGRPKKKTADYRAIASKIEAGWSGLVSDPRFVQAREFHSNIMNLGI